MSRQKLESIELTKKWITLFVIKNNFCPFAANPFTQDKICYESINAKNKKDIVDALISGLIKIRDVEHDEIETTLIILTHCLQDFDEYNAFLDIVDAILEEMNLIGEIQVASFHPNYCFAGLTPDDVRNYTNRSPYPMFHLLREKSIESARNVYPDIEQIPENNMALLEKLGLPYVLESLSKLKCDQNDV